MQFYSVNQVVGDLLVLTACFAQVDVATTLWNIAMLHKGQGRVADARRLVQEAHDAWLSVVGPSHPHTAMAKQWLEKNASA